MHYISMLYMDRVYSYFLKYNCVSFFFYFYLSLNSTLRSSAHIFIIFNNITKWLQDQNNQYKLSDRCKPISVTAQ